MRKKTFLKNTLILIISNFFIKFLGLFNRVLLTRLLGNQGISLYVICVPTIILLLTLGGYSLNTAVSKVIASNKITNKYSEQQILRTAFTIASIVSVLTIIIFLIILKPLTFKWLKQPDAFYPLLSAVFIIPLVAFNNILRGYYNGIKKVNISAYAGLIEQISRMIFSISFLFLFLKRGIIFSVMMTIFAMSIGEFISMIYCFILLKKAKIRTSTSNNNPNKEILAIATPATLTRLVSSFTHFLEPIIYTLALTKIGLGNVEIAFQYSKITAYVEPLLYMFTFISSSIAFAIVPILSEALALKNEQRIQELTKKAILASLLVALFFNSLLYFYSSEFMYFFYKTTFASEYVKRFSFLFIFAYLLSPLVMILNSIGKATKTLVVTIICDIIKLLIIFFLVFDSKINVDSLIYGISASILLTMLLLYISLKNEIKLKFKFTEILNILIIFTIHIIFIYLCTLINLNFILSSFITAVLFLVNIFILKFFRFNYKK